MTGVCLHIAVSNPAQFLWLGHMQMSFLLTARKLPGPVTGLDSNGPEICASYSCAYLLANSATLVEEVTQKLCDIPVIGLSLKKSQSTAMLEMTPLPI